MINTTSQFIKASPQMKPVLVLDGYTYVAEQYDRMQKELKVLTAWLDVIPSLIETGKCHVPDIAKFCEVIQQFEASRDGLTAQFVDHESKLNAFAKFLKQNQFV